MFYNPYKSASRPKKLKLKKSKNIFFWLWQLFTIVMFFFHKINFRTWLIDKKAIKKFAGKNFYKIISKVPYSDPY